MENTSAFEHKNWMNVVYASQFLRFLDAKGFACNTLLDVGAWRGDWSRNFKAIYPQSRVVMVEPLEEMRPHLEKFCTEFPDSKFVLAGAGPKPGEMEFTIWPGLSGSSFVPERGQPLFDTYGKRTVPVVTINQLIERGDLTIPEIAKLDVQGFELDVLKGASTILGQTEVFLLEVSLFKPLGPQMPVFFDIVNFMNDHKYVTYDITGFYRRRKDHALAQCDIAFVRENSSLRRFEGLVKEFEWDVTKCQG